MNPPARRLADLYAYELDFNALTPTTPQTQTFQIQQNSDFRWTKASYFADIGLAVQTFNTIVIPLVTVQIQDQGSGQFFSNTPVPLISQFGFGFLPFILPIPRTFAGRSAVSVTLANYTAATTYNIRLTFWGQRIYDIGAK